MISKNYDDEDLNLNHIFSSKLSPRSKKVWSHNSGISADGFEDKHKLLSIIPYLTPPPLPHEYQAPLPKQVRLGYECLSLVLSNLLFGLKVYL